MSENPFTTATVKGDKFFGRASIIDEILDDSSPRNAIYLIGSRRVGKTSLLHQISHVNENIIDSPKFFSLVWDMSGAKDLKGLSNNLYRDINDIKDQFKTIDIISEELREKDVFEILNEIKLKTKQKNKKLLLLCDEAEALNEISKNDPDLLPKLRHYFLYGNIKTVITANRALLQLNKSDNRDIATFLDGFVTIYLSHLDDDAADQLVRLGSFDKNIEQEIMERTDNHPYLLQSLCQNYYNEGDLNKAVLDVWTQGVVNNCYEYDFKYFSGKEKEIIYNILDKVCIKLNDIQTYMSIQQEELERLIHPLLKLRYIIEKKNQFSIGNYFFKGWLKSNIPPNNENNGLEPNPPNPESEKILTYLNFFEEIKQKRRLDEFSHDGFVTVHEFRNDQGKIEKTTMGKLLEELEKISKHECNVLITGETGTGKELLAKKIHNQGLRKAKKIVTVNCAAITLTIAESELFGYTKGAHSTAFQDKIGYFESANGGTIFLDEIGKLNKEIQGKILRAIAEKEIQRVGSEKTIKVDVRVISATNENLKEAIEQEKFLIDLYYRLNQLFLHIPPLRERKCDIPFLIQHFLTEFNKGRSTQISLSGEAIKALMCYSWKGNVRELQNTINHVLRRAEKNIIELTDLNDEILLSYHETFKESGWQQIEKEVENEKERLIEIIKLFINDEKVDEFIQSVQLKIHYKTYADCHEYFKAYIDDRALSCSENERKCLAQKMIVKMWNELCSWRKQMGHRDVVIFLHPKLKTILGVDRKTINNWEKELRKLGKL